MTLFLSDKVILFFALLRYLDVPSCPMISIITTLGRIPNLALCQPSILLLFHPLSVFLSLAQISLTAYHHLWQMSLTAYHHLWQKTAALIHPVLGPQGASSIGLSFIPRLNLPLPLSALNQNKHVYPVPFISPVVP